MVGRAVLGVPHRELPLHFTFASQLSLRPTAVVFFGACGSLSDGAMDYAIDSGAEYLMCRTCCHDNIGGNVTVTTRRTYVNWFFRFKNLIHARLQRTPKYAAFYHSPRYPRSCYLRSAAGRELTDMDEFLAVAGDRARNLEPLESIPPLE